MKYLLLIAVLFITSCSLMNGRTFITCENIQQFKKRTEIKGIVDIRDLTIRTLDNKRITLSKGAVCSIEEIQE